MMIVCGTDFSDQARAAEIAAGSLAARLANTDFWLVHALDPIARSLDEGARQVLMSSAQRLLKEHADELAARTGGRAQVLTLSGPPVEALRKCATDKKADLIVVGSQGYGATPLYHVGGTSERLAQLSDVPVMVVRSSEPFEAWMRRERALRILLATDWTRSSDAAIQWVKSLRKAAPCDVIVGYVYYSGPTGEGSKRYGLPGYSMVEAEPETERLLARDLATRVGDVGGAGDVVFRPKHGFGRLGDHLLELAEEERADVIFLGTHHKRGFERLSSVASVALHFSHASVAVVPVSPEAAQSVGEVPLIRRVLVPTDLSPLSNAAVASAYALLTDRHGEIYLFHAAAPEGAVRDPEIAAELRSLVPSRGVPETVTTRTEVVRQRDAARAIREAAERLGADAICMGSKGRTGLKRTVLGSVAESVLRESRCPVFVVRALPP